MHIGRTRFKKDIVAEFIAPKNTKSDKVMIFCSGMPSAPYKDDVLEFYSKKGFWTFFPRYRGSWESSGIFLEKSPHIDVLDVIDGLNDKFKDYWGEKTYRVKAKHITVVGTSFGGPAAILATLDKRVNKAIAISPVVDWKSEDKSDPLNNLYDFTKNAYGGSYRLNKKYWNKLSSGKFYNPLHHINELDREKILILHAENDDIVRYKPVAKFVSKLGCEFISFKRGGHLSSTILLNYRYYWRVIKFLQK